MSELVPIFPLPGGVLLPRSTMPLHVFEPRYRRMFDDLLDGDRRIAIALLDAEGEPDRFGRPAIFPTAGVGLVERAIRLPDGRYNVVVGGTHRARLEELDPQPVLPYRRAHAFPLEEREAPSAAGTESLRGLLAAVAAELGLGRTDVIDRLDEIAELGALADVVAAVALPIPNERQKVLELLDVEARAHHVAGALGALLAAMRGTTPS